MKKNIFLLIVGLTFSVAQSQEISDAVRYSQDNLYGTARFKAMSGAFGALGGDLSSININPAGSAIFSNNQIGITLNNLSTKNNSTYYNTNTSDSNSTFDLDQAGAAFVFKNRNPKSDWKKYSITINYEKTNNYDNSFFSAGVNPTNSVANYFTYYANGVSLSTLESSNYYNLGSGEQQAYLGYQAYIINPLSSTDPDNTEYLSNVTAGGNYYQENSITTTGYNGKLSFNAATSYKDKLYLGVSLNSHFIDFTRASNFYESNDNTLGDDYTVTTISFDNLLYTYGSGFSFQLGAIAKVTNEIRLGLAFESPTWYKLNDELTQKIVAISENSGSTSYTDVVNPNVTNYYDPYKIATPSKITGSFAYIFGKSGLISIDYALKDYSSTKFTPENDSYFITLNNEIKNTLTTSAELRIGAEYKIQRWSLRGGYRHEESPYIDKTTIGDLNGYSGGLGYNFGATKLDVSYSKTKRTDQQGFFDQGFTEGASINSKNNFVSMTLTFEL
jgi:hypothetical protein